MSETMQERGPDDHGSYMADGIGLVHRRLSIIDLSQRGRCPMPNEDGTVQVVHNGEIYDHKALRNELISRGHKFASHSDTEVLVHGYEEWGTELVGRLEGMFAFAVWDAKCRRLLLARDRLGQKPLYYMHTHKSLVFASTLNAVIAYLESAPEVDLSALECYLSHAFIPAPHTIWRGVNVLPPGHIAILNEMGGFTVKRYWDFPHTPPSKIDLRDAEELVETALERSIKARLIADVPVGAFLSGGVDSSLVAALAVRNSQTIDTFSIGFRESDFSELPYARQVAQHLGTNHHELILNPDDLLDTVPELVWQCGQPFGDSSIIPTHLLSRFARQKVTVSLSGDGGDESFAGYWRTAAGWYASLYRRGIPQAVRTTLVPWLTGKVTAVGAPSIASRISALNQLSLAPPGTGYTNALTWYNDRESIRGPLANETPSSHEPAACRAGRPWGDRAGSELQRLLYDDFQVLLPDDYLVKVDVASMATSLEVRSPFLDHHFVEMAWGLPDSVKLHWGSGKRLLKRLAARHVPPSVIYRRKMGFALPMKHWWRGELAGVLTALMTDSRAVEWGWIRPDPVREALNHHVNGRGQHDVRLWLILWLELWARIVVEGSLPRSVSLKEIA